MNPFRTNVRDPVYVPARAQDVQLVRDQFEVLEGNPAAVKRDLYMVASLLASQKELVSYDDRQTLDTYRRRRGAHRE
jgi:hypothetical protein